VLNRSGKETGPFVKAFYRQTFDDVIPEKQRLEKRWKASIHRLTVRGIIQ